MTMNKLGIDVSHWQGSFDWNKARQAGIQFAFIKATQGNTILDDRFNRNWIESQLAGVPRGCYHFYDPRLNPILQADWLLKTCPEPGELGYVLDAEALKTKIPVKIPVTYATDLRIFCERIEQKTQTQPIIYTAYSFWTTNCSQATWARRYALWIANYNNIAPMTPLPWGPDGWEFWQFTDKGIGKLYGTDASSKQIDLDVWRQA